MLKFHKISGVIYALICIEKREFSVVWNGEHWYAFSDDTKHVELFINGLTRVFNETESRLVQKFNNEFFETY